MCSLPNDSGVNRIEGRLRRPILLCTANQPRSAQWRVTELLSKGFGRSCVEPFYLLVWRGCRRCPNSSAEPLRLFTDRNRAGYWRRWCAKSAEQGPDRRRYLAHRKRSSIAPLRRLHSAGGHCGRSRREFLRGIDGLAPDYAALRPVASDSAIPGCRT